MSRSHTRWLTRAACASCSFLILLDAGQALALPAAIEQDPDLAPVADPIQRIDEVDGFLTQLLRQNTDVLTAQLEVERTRGVARQALAALLPSVNASGTVQFAQPNGSGVSSQNGGASTNSTAGLIVTSAPVYATAGLSLSQSLVAPRSWYALGTSQRSTASAHATAKDRVRTTLLLATGDLLAERSAASAADASRVGLRAALEVMAMTARRLELGSATRLDLVRTQQDVESARSTVISANEALQKAREALGLVLGQSHAVAVEGTLSIDAIEAAIAQRCTEVPSARRPDVEAAAIDVEIAQRTLQDSALAYLPSLSLSASFSASSVTQLSGDHWSANLLGSLTVPIWDGGGREGTRRAALASLNVKRLQFEGVTRAATVQAVQTTRGIAVAAEAEEVAQRAYNLAAERARLTRAAFDSGTGTSFDLVDAARQARAAELDRVAKQYARARARIEARLAAASCTS